MTIELPKNVATALFIAVAAAVVSGAYLTGVWHAEPIQVNVANTHNAHMNIIDERLN